MSRRREIWNRKEMTKAMVTDMFSMIQNSHHCSKEDIDMFCRTYKKLIARVHEDFAEISSLLQEEG